MATTFLRAESAPANLTLHDIQSAAAALRRLNEIDSAPVLSLEDRQEVMRAKATCWTVIGAAAEALVSLMDAVAGDCDDETTNAEDERIDPRFTADCGPGCEVSDGGDIAWTERRDQTRAPLPNSPAHFQSNEDAEDDDAAEEDDHSGGDLDLGEGTSGIDC